MIEYFDIDNLEKGAYCVGELTDSIIKSTKINIQKTKILISKDKIQYTYKHIKEYDNYYEYKKLIESTPNIISNPDYVGLHPNGKSIEFIKRMSKIMIVAVRIKPKGILWVKTIFTITDDKLKLYKKSKSLVEFKS